jgi:hypothetical protein
MHIFKNVDLPDFLFFIMLQINMILARRFSINQILKRRLSNE